MTPAEQFRQTLLRANYSSKTAELYSIYIRDWLRLDDPIGESQAWIDAMADAGLAPTTISKKWSAVLCFLRVVRVDDTIPEVRLPKIRNRRTRGAFTRAEIARLRGMLPQQGRSYLKQRIRTLFYMLYGTGIRLGEAMQIRWQDVALDEGSICVRAQKNGQGQFHVPILPVVEDEIRILERFGVRPWVFGSAVGNKPNAETLQRPMRLLIRRVNPDRCLHSLRHSFITHLIEEGVSLPYVQRLARHQRLATTERYLHLTQQAADAELRAKHPLA